MCIQALIGAALGAGGAIMRQVGANKQAAEIARARNDVLRETMRRNDEIAASNRQLFDSRTSDYAPEAFQQSAADANAARGASLESAVESAPDTSAPISGSAPTIVQSELAKTFADAMTRGKDNAARLAKLGSYGDTWFNQGIANNATGRDVGVNNNFAGGNLAIMPYLQDFAEIAATKPNMWSTLGGVMSGAGNLIGSGAGAGVGKNLAMARNQGKVITSVFG